MFGGSAWARVDDGQWYLHLFAAEQPDLNWDNPEVRDGLPDDAAVLVGPWGRRLPGRRRARAGQEPRPSRFPSKATLARQSECRTAPTRCGTRTSVHEIYAEWRKVFNEYDPPRSAVAEACRYRPPPAPGTRARTGSGRRSTSTCCRPTGTYEKFRQVIADNLALAEQNGSSSTWVFSNHDVVRHADPVRPAEGPDRTWQDAEAWLLSNGTAPTVDVDLGSAAGAGGHAADAGAAGIGLPVPGRGARPARGRRTAGGEPAGPGVLPLQGRREGPRRLPGADPVDGRAACRSASARAVRTCVQPKWFGGVLRRGAGGRSGIDAEPVPQGPRRTPGTAGRQLAELGRRQPDWVLHFTRPGGWQSVTNFGAAPVELPDAAVVLSSGPLEGDKLPGDTTAWLI